MKKPVKSENSNVSETLAFPDARDQLVAYYKGMRDHFETENITLKTRIAALETEVAQLKQKGMN